MQTTLSHTIIKLSIIALTLVFAFVGAGVASAKSTPASAVRGCDTNGAPIINVTQKVDNSIDSGFQGYWAYDDYNRVIKVYDNGDGTFCAEVTYQGKFDAVAGKTSPGDNAEELTGEEDGTFNGGYQATITGTLLAEPAWKTKGSVGTTDYACDIDTATCPGAVNWLDQYFEAGYGFAYDFWGWTYNHKNCVWVNASTGSSGDIVCGAFDGGPGDPL